MLDEGDFGSSDLETFVFRPGIGGGAPGIDLPSTNCLEPEDVLWGGEMSSSDSAPSLCLLGAVGGGGGTARAGLVLECAFLPSRTGTTYLLQALEQVYSLVLAELALVNHVLVAVEAVGAL